MSKVLRITDGDYRVIVDNGVSGKIILDTTSGSDTPRGTVVVTGDLEVKGTTTTVESTVTTIADNILNLMKAKAEPALEQVLITKQVLKLIEVLYLQQELYLTNKFRL